MQPVHAVELYPMPAAKVEGGDDGMAPPSECGDDADGEAANELRPPPPPRPSDDGTEVSWSSVSRITSFFH